MLPGHFEATLNHWDYFKLLFLQKQWEMAEAAVLPEESCITCFLQWASAPTPSSEFGIQLALNAARVHPTQLAVDRGWYKTFCPCQQHGLACSWPPITRPAQQLCLSLCVQDAHARCMQQAGGVLFPPEILWHAQPFPSQAKDNTCWWGPPEATHCRTNVTGQLCPGNLPPKPLYWYGAGLKCFPTTPGEIPPPHRHIPPPLFLGTPDNHCSTSHSLSAELRPYWSLSTGN